MSLQFYAYARKGYEFIDDVARQLNTTDTEKAGRLTRCVIRAVRNRLSFEDSFGFLAQLPMALKGVYVDGWKVSGSVVNSPTEFDFISEVVKEDDNSAWRDFSNEAEVKEAILAVFAVFSKHFGPHEIKNLVKILPMNMQDQLNKRITS